MTGNLLVRLIFLICLVIWEISLRDFLGDILRPSGQAQRRVPFRKVQLVNRFAQ